MRSHEVSLRALAAVARLTIFAGAAGCVGTVAVEEDETPADVDPGETDPGDPPGVVIDIGPTDIKPVEATCFDGEQDAAPCCDVVLNDAFADEELLNDPSLATAEEKACCELAVTTMDTWMGPEEPPFTNYVGSTCCITGLVDGAWEVHPSCTPWGPPMPPAMPRGFSFELFEVVA